MLHRQTGYRLDLTEHYVELTSEEPVLSKCYWFSPKQSETLDREVKRMLELGVIKASESEYASPMILVEVPSKDPRPIVDYRKLIALTEDQMHSKYWGEGGTGELSSLCDYAWPYSRVVASTTHWASQQMWTMLPRPVSQRIRTAMCHSSHQHRAINWQWWASNSKMLPFVFHTSWIGF